MVPQRQIETPPSDRQQKSKFQNTTRFSLQSIQNDPCIKVYLTFKSMWENINTKYNMFFHEHKNPIKIQQHFLILLSKNVCKCNMHFCFFHFTNTYLVVVWSKKKVQSTCVMGHYWFTRNNYHICIIYKRQKSPFLGSFCESHYE